MRMYSMWLPSGCEPGSDRRRTGHRTAVRPMLASLLGWLHR
jgi:hypothetical protein